MTDVMDRTLVIASSYMKIQDPSFVDGIYHTYPVLHTTRYIKRNGVYTLFVSLKC